MITTNVVEFAKMLIEHTETNVLSFIILYSPPVVLECLVFLYPTDESLSEEKHQKDLLLVLLTSWKGAFKG